MATQTTRGNEQQTQSSQGQAMTRGSQQQRRGGYALGLPLTPVDLLRMDPFSLMRRMTQELDRAFGAGDGGEQTERVWAPAIEVTQREGNYVVRAELAGVKPNEVRLVLTDDAIVLEGERKEEHEENRGGIHVSERRYGRFYRAIPLPEGAKTDQVTARFDNGVLEITVPTEEPRSKSREIPIQGSSEGATGSSGEQAGSSAGSTGSSGGSTQTSGEKSGTTSGQPGGSEKAA